MNTSAVKNVNCNSVSTPVVNTNTAFYYGVRFFAYSVFYYFFSGKFTQRISHVSA